MVIKVFIGFADFLNVIRIICKTSRCNSRRIDHSNYAIDRHF